MPKDPLPSMSIVNDEIRPTPDPTVLTTQQLDKGLASERDYVDGQIAVLVERLNAVDRLVANVPKDRDREVGHLRELMQEHFAGVDKRLHERDVRFDTAAVANKTAVDAAFQAQREAASEQNKANQAAIAKSEKAVADTLAALQTLFTTSATAQRDQLDDLKDRVGKIEATKAGGQEVTTERRNQQAALIGLLGFVLVVVMVAAPVIAVLAAK